MKNGNFAPYCQTEQLQVRIMVVGTETFSDVLVYLNGLTQLPAL